MGHGRRLESLLVMISGSYGLFLLAYPASIFDSRATQGVALSSGQNMIVAALLVEALLAGYGLIGNIRMWPAQRASRIAGGMWGMALWIWFIAQFHYAGVTFSFGSFCAFWFYIYSIAVVGMALANRPLPGAPGQQ